MNEFERKAYQSLLSVLFDWSGDEMRKFCCWAAAEAKNCAWADFNDEGSIKALKAANWVDWDAGVCIAASEGDGDWEDALAAANGGKMDRSEGGNADAAATNWS